MKIAFDAKRAYQNGTGLGHYSRTLIRSLATFHPEHSYYLCAPKVTDRFNASRFSHVHNIIPSGFMATTFKSAWRSNWVKKDLLLNGIEVYHGLSHEVPIGIDKTGIKSVVTIHDLIFERYPEQYKKIDREIYRRKFSYACKHATRVIAISNQTKDDIINFYKIPADKIDVCYQSCNPAFAEEVSEDVKLRAKKQYRLPDQFFLYVGSVIERKNLLNICKALVAIKDKIDIPLVVIGEGSKYKQQVFEYCKEHNIQAKVIFLNEDPVIAKNPAFKSGDDFPAIYQQALCLIYPSFFEGFGIPVLEALCSKLPVITSNISCMPETGGDAAYYVDPYSVDDISNAMLHIADNRALREQMKVKGWQHAQNFTPEKCAEEVMQVYLRL